MAKQTRFALLSACWLGLALGSVPFVTGCGSSGSDSGEVVKRDEAKQKSEAEATAAAFKEPQKSLKKARRR